jgi:serine/threonine protein kinase
MAEPEVIGRYRIEKELGQGGMSVVYLARDPYMKRRVAIKILPRHYAAENGFLLRFQREAQVIASLEHPAIVPVHDFGEHDGQPYIVMRYMPGGSLADRLKRGPLGLAEAARILDRLAPALDEAHAQGIIHRDLKPGNILFDQCDRAYLCDFGLVKFSEISATPLTSSGGVVGTPAYMSPEQARGVSTLDGRTDVYSLGVIFYEMLAGALPYRAETPMGLAMMHVLEPVPSILARKPDVPPGADAIIRRAMAKEREDRYPTPTALAAAVGRLAEAERAAAAVAALQSPPEPPAPFWRRGRVPLWLFGGTVTLAALAVALVMGGIIPSSAWTPGAPEAPLTATATTSQLARPAVPSATTAPSPTATWTPTVTPTPTMTPTATVPTQVPVVVPTNTRRPPPTNTPVPPTNTLPPPTNTPVPPPPAPTNTPKPPPTNTPPPAATNTPPPSAPTNTPPPAPTNTPPL